MPGWAVGLVVAAAVLVGATVFGVLWRRRDGALRPVAPGAATPEGTDRGAEPAGAAAAPDTAVLAELGAATGAPATLLQFSSAFCAPCRATRRICTELSGMLDGVRYVEIDAEEHLDAVRALKVLRTPTLFVIDRDGRVVRRASGRPTKPHLIAALAPLLDEVSPAGDGV